MRFFAGAAAAALVLTFGHGASAYNGDPDYWDYDGGMALESDSSVGLASGPSGVGLSFEGVSQNDVRALHSNFSLIPPDTMGAVGASQFMETSNGAYAIYNKTTGALESKIGDGAFWLAAGGSESATLGNGFSNGDSRILYDKPSGRWVVEQFGATDDRIQIAVSQTSDALGPWKATSFEGFNDGVGTGIADYPTLAIDSKAIYIGTNDFTNTPSVCGGIQFCGTTLNVISRSDIFGASGPSVGSLKQFFTPYGSADNGFAIQGVNQVNGNDSGQIATVGVLNYGLVHYTVVNPGSSGSTTTSGVLLDTTPYLANNPGAQPNGSHVIDTLDDRVSSGAYEFNGRIYAVHVITPTGSSHSYIQWYVFDAKTNTVIQEGLIGDGVHDFWQGAIVVSPNGKVMIGYNESGLDKNISIYALQFKQAGGGAIAPVGNPLLLHVSPIDDYHNGSPEGSPPAGRQRWGDYAQVTVDPNNANSFWNIGEFARPYDNNTTSFSRWGTWITNIVATPEPSTWVMSILGFGALGAALRRRRQAQAA
jgi:hypothetical protein